MLSDGIDWESFFNIAVSAIKKEDALLETHCRRRCGYHHGIGWVREPILVHLIVRALLKSGFDVDVRTEQPYESDPRLQADLVFLSGGKWIACVEAKWLQSWPTAHTAKGDMERMRRKSKPEVRKFLLAFWINDRREVTEWLEFLKQAPAVSLLRYESFDTKWWDEKRDDFRLAKAGLTLFEVNQGG